MMDMLSFVVGVVVGVLGCVGVFAGLMTLVGGLCGDEPDADH